MNNIPTWTSYNSKAGRIFKSWRVQDEAGQLVCTLPDTIEGHKLADMIAAAPALLEALKLLLDYVRENTNDAKAAIPRGVARAAIDRATGGGE